LYVGQPYRLFRTIFLGMRCMGLGGWMNDIEDFFQAESSSSTMTGGGKSLNVRQRTRWSSELSMESVRGKDER